MSAAGEARVRHLLYGWGANRFRKQTKGGATFLEVLKVGNNFCPTNTPVSYNLNKNQNNSLRNMPWLSNWNTSIDTWINYNSIMFRIKVQGHCSPWAQIQGRLNRIRRQIQFRPELGQVWVNSTSDSNNCRNIAKFSTTIIRKEFNRFELVSVRLEQP